MRNTFPEKQTIFTDAGKHVCECQKMCIYFIRQHKIMIYNITERSTRGVSSVTHKQLIQSAVANAFDADFVIDII